MILYRREGKKLRIPRKRKKAFKGRLWSKFIRIRYIETDSFWKEVRAEGYLPSESETVG